MLGLKQLDDKPDAATVHRFPRPRVRRPVLSAPSGVTDAAMADAIGVATSTIFAWRTGRHEPQKRHLPRLHALNRLLIQAGAWR